MRLTRLSLPTAGVLLGLVPALPLPSAPANRFQGGVARSFPC